MNHIVNRDKVYYVYGHFTADDSELFYIGVGTYKRAVDRHSRNKIWKGIVEKKGFYWALLSKPYADRDEAVKEEIRLQIIHKPRACIVYGDRMRANIPSSTREKMSKSNKGRKLSDDHKMKLSISKKGELNPMYGKTGVRNSFYGKKHSEESKEKMSTSHKEFFKANGSPLKGKKLSEDHKQKLSKARQGSKHTPEARRKVSEGNKGKKRSPEVCRRMSERVKGDKNPMYGKVYSKEERDQISERQRGHNNPFYGKSHSDETKLKLSDIHSKKVINCRGQVFKSRSEAAEYFNLKSDSSIQNNISGRSKSAGRYEDGTKVTWKNFEEFK